MIWTRIFQAVLFLALATPLYSAGKPKVLETFKKTPKLKGFSTVAAEIAKREIKEKRGKDALDTTDPKVWTEYAGEFDKVTAPHIYATFHAARYGDHPHQYKMAQYFHNGVKAPGPSGEILLVPNVFQARCWYEEAFDSGHNDATTNYLPYVQICLARKSKWISEARRVLNRIVESETPSLHQTAAHILLGLAYLTEFRSGPINPFLAMHHACTGFKMLSGFDDSQRKSFASLPGIPDESQIENAQRELNSFFQARFNTAVVPSIEVKDEHLESYIEYLQSVKAELRTADTFYLLYILTRLQEGSDAPDGETIGYLEDSTRRGHVFGEVHLSRHFYEQGDTASLLRARTILRGLKERKGLPSPDPLISYAHMCLEGKGGTTDRAEAISALQIARTTFDSTIAAFDLAGIYIQDPNRKLHAEGVSIFEGLSSRRSPYHPALHVLAKCHVEGSLGKPKNPKTALTLLLRAWDGMRDESYKNSPHPKRVLDDLIHVYELLGEEGVHEEGDKKKRMKIYEEAAKDENAIAQFRLAQWCERADPVKAIGLYEAALKGGQAQAKIPLGMLLINTPAQNMERGVALLAEEADKLTADHTYGVYQALQKRKHGSAWEWLKKSALKGHVVALREVAKKALSRRARERDPALGLTILEKLAGITRDAAVMVQIADIYFDHSEGERDDKFSKSMEAAITWTERAAEAGHVDSAAFLARRAEDLGNLGSAEKWYDLTYRADPKKYGYAYWRVLHEQDKKEGAQAIWKRSNAGLLGFARALAENDAKLLDVVCVDKIPAATLYRGFRAGRIADPKELSRQMEASPHGDADFAILGDFLDTPSELPTRFAMHRFLKAKPSADKAVNAFVRAHLLEGGYIFEDSPRLALKFYNIAAAAGHSESAFRAGEAYRHGLLGLLAKGINLEIARALYSKAALKRHGAATEALVEVNK